jgi:hypothetical protein
MDNNLSLYDDFLASTGPDRLQKILARHELFRMVQDVPGDIVECGVFKGSGIYTWAKLMRLFRPHNETRIVGFDFFETNRAMDFRFQADKDCLDEHESRWTPQDVILENCRAWGFDRLDLIAGNVVETTKTFVRENLGARISLLYLDVDNYEGALACLQNLYPLVSPGGLVVFDEYALRTYGESDAVDEFFKGKNLRLRSIPWANTPSAYLIKETF